MGLIPKGIAQAPPVQVCADGKSIFAISGDTLSSFRFSITGGVLLDTINRDSIVVQWGLQSDVHRLGVQEIALGGCEGEW
ncbi:MAG: hypothetical protein LBU91_02070, partial [Bacteroidales bacterium]|nr:hypothetical protein [Bacteroidales bacterium]